MNVTFSGNTIFCPYCGGRARVMDGTFNVRAGAIEMLEGPAWSWDLVEELGLTLRRIVEVQPPDPVGAIAEVSPELSRDVERATEGWPFDRKIALIAALVAVVTADYGQVADLLQAMAAVLTYAMQHGTPPPPL